MSRFLNVLGFDLFCQHVKNVFTLVDSVQSDVYDEFCRLCQQKDGLDLNKLSVNNASFLLMGF